MIFQQYYPKKVFTSQKNFRNMSGNFIISQGNCFKMNYSKLESV